MERVDRRGREPAPLQPFDLCAFRLSRDFGELEVEPRSARRSERRGSVLGFVSDGAVWLGPDRSLRFAFSLRGGLLLCLLLAPVAAGLTWATLGSPELAAFWLVAPVLWLYGANHVITAVRVPAYMTSLCRTAPVQPGAAQRGSSAAPRFREHLTSPDH